MINMKVKELIKELQKYPEDTEVFVEDYNNDFWVIYIDEPWLEFKEKIHYSVEENWNKYYANFLRHDWILNNVLVIS